MVTINRKIRGSVIAWGVMLGLTILAFVMAGCSSAKSVTGPTPHALSDAASIRVTTTTPAETSAPAPTLPGGPGVAADPPPQALPNCTELDPKKWIGFAWSVTAEEITIWNNSPCVRVTTWRAFAVGAGSSQAPAGPDMVVTVPAFAGFTDGRPYRVKVVYYGDGKPPCGALIQIDGRAGIVTDMKHENASFTPGALFRIPPCAPRNDPPKTCVEPGFGPWVLVPVSNASIVEAMTVPVYCPKMQRSRVKCDGTTEIEPRPSNWCFEN